MSPNEFRTYSADETIARGRELAALLKPPIVVLLSGELGSGKTTFSKGIISGLDAAAEDEVTSPTFTLVHVFRGRYNVFHVDLYRVDGFHDLETLGLEDALSEPAIVIVEWPEKFSLRTDWPVLRVSLEHAGRDARRIQILGPSG